MQLIKKQERIGNFAFTVAIWIHLILMSIELGVWNVPYFGRLMHLAFVLSCLKIVTTYYSKKEWLLMAGFGCLGVLSYFNTGDEYIISVVVLVFAAKSADIRRVCKRIFYTTAVFTVGIAILSLCNIGGVPVIIRNYGRGVEEARWCFGFGHANNFHGTVWYVVALGIYLFFEKMDWKHYLILTVGNCGLFYLTASKGGFIVTQLVILAAMSLRYIKPLADALWPYILGVIGVVAVLALSIVSVCIGWTEYTESAILRFLDRLFTGRINLAFQHAHISQWKWLSSGGELADTVDNGWVNFGYYFGGISVAVLVAFHFYLIYRLWKERNALLMAVVVSNALYTFMETTFTMNSSYLLCNLAYITAMILLAEKEGNDNGREEIERNSHSNISL